MVLCICYSWKILFFVVVVHHQLGVIMQNVDAINLLFSANNQRKYLLPFWISSSRNVVTSETIIKHNSHYFYIHRINGRLYSHSSLHSLDIYWRWRIPADFGCFARTCLYTLWSCQLTTHSHFKMEFIYFLLDEWEKNECLFISQAMESTELWKTNRSNLCYVNWCNKMQLSWNPCIHELQASIQCKHMCSSFLIFLWPFYLLHQIRESVHDQPLTLLSISKNNHHSIHFISFMGRDTNASLPIIS